MSAYEPDDEPEERIADALERRNELLEDQNAILHDGIQTLIWALYDEEGRANPEGRPPRIAVEDGLAELHYLTIHGGRSDGRPEEER